MSVRRLSNSTISTQGRGKSSTFIAGYSPAIDEMDLIERVTLSNSASSITFSNIPQTYQHLQIRSCLKYTELGIDGVTNIIMQLNGDTSNTNYSRHDLFGNGSGAFSQGNPSMNFVPGPVSQTASNESIFAVSIIDILDYTSTSKNKTLRFNSGGVITDSNGAVFISSMSWMNTAAVNSVAFVGWAGKILSPGSVSSLYGVVR